MVDFTFFARENTVLKASYLGFKEEAYKKELAEACANNQNLFAEAKTKYAQCGALIGDNGDNSDYGGNTLAEKQIYYSESYHLLDKLGGGACDAN